MTDTKKSAAPTAPAKGNDSAKGANAPNTGNTSGNDSSRGSDQSGAGQTGSGKGGESGNR